MVSRQTALSDKFLDVTMREGISQIPTDGAENDRRFEVPPFEKRRSRFTYAHSLADPSAGFATQP
jgi:hypothetical protein